MIIFNFQVEVHLHFHHPVLLFQGESVMTTLWLLAFGSQGLGVSQSTVHWHVAKETMRLHARHSEVQPLRRPTISKSIYAGG